MYKRQKLFKLLKERGVLIVAVPNPSSYDAEKYKEWWAAVSYTHLSETDEVDSRNSCSYSCEIESLLSRVGE